jgi:ribosomal protein S18 acetylase RimI-like enzyme
MRIRALRPADLDRIFGPVSRQSGAAWLERQARSEVYVAVAELDGTPVGRAGLDFERSGDDGTAFLWAAHVEPAWQSRGVGTRIVRHLEDVARTRGFVAVRLAVAKDNARAQALYERLGYEVRGETVERWSYWDQGREVDVVEDCWLMERRLVD